MVDPVRVQQASEFLNTEWSSEATSPLPNARISLA